MKTYRVLWEIDIEAETPVEAAKRAREYQRPGTCALVFECIHDGVSTLVDLETEEDEE